MITNKFLRFSKLVIAFVLALMWVLPPPASAGRVISRATTTVDLSTTTYASYAEAVSIDMAGQYGGNGTGDFLLVRVTTTSASGGAFVAVKFKAKWTSDLADTTYLDLLVQDADDTAPRAAPVTNTGANASLVWAVGFGGGSAQFSAHIMPPFVSVFLREDHTSGTLTIETYLVKLD